jgi:hypothetical protein
MSATQVRFDESLPALVDAVHAELGPDALTSGVALRDATGRLSFFVRGTLDAAKREALSTRLLTVLGPYAREERVVVDASELGAESILGEPSAIHVKARDTVVTVVDRRIVGADWLRAPSDVATGPRRFAFTSLKGGVGRSTALAVVAAHLAGKGNSVLTIDLDLEAPGLGALLLKDDTAPEFGTIDFLVENKITDVGGSFLADLVGPSGLSARGGRIDVAPAFGRRSLKNPADVLAKLARAYVERVRPDGTAATLVDQIRELVDALVRNDRYDAVLIDARAGLHETTAASVLGLGADVFLFGIDEPQTFHGYAALLSHMARLIGPGEPTPEWVDRLTPVHAKASADPKVRAGFLQRWQQLVARYGPVPRPVARTGEVMLPEGFKDVPWDEAVPDEEVLPGEWALNRPLTILHDDRYVGFDPLKRAEVIESPVYTATFGDILQRVEDAMTADEEAQP